MNRRGTVGTRRQVSSSGAEVFRLGVTMQAPQMYPPAGLKELIRTIWSLIRRNRVLNLGVRGGGVHLGGVHV